MPNCIVKSAEPLAPAPALKITTIGVYGFHGASFLHRLQSAKVSLLLDMHQSRGVRGPDSAWANSRRLHAALATAKIGYNHHPELATTIDLRQLQYAEDARVGVGTSSRVELAVEYTRRNTAEILDRANLARIISALPDHGIAAPFCVECDSQACHRSLIAKRLSGLHGVAVEHLPP